MPIPNRPPAEFMSTSVISLAPTAKTYWITSNRILVQIMGKNCFSSDFFSHSTQINMPKGMNASRFCMISPKSIFPFIMTDSPNGIRLILLICGNSMAENAILKIMIQDSAAR